MIAYLQNLFAAVSHLLNAIRGGSARYPLSAAAGEAAEDGERWGLIAEAIIDRLLFSKNHCREQAAEYGLI